MFLNTEVSVRASPSGAAGCGLLRRAVASANRGGAPEGYNKGGYMLRRVHGQFVFLSSLGFFVAEMLLLMPQMGM